MSNLIYLLSPLQREGTSSLPMISFMLVESKIDLSSINLLLFTSKQAVVSMNEINHEWSEQRYTARTDGEHKALRQN